MATNMYGEEIFNKQFVTCVKSEGTKIGEKVLKVIDRAYFPDIVVNKEKGIFRYDWSPSGDVKFPDYAHKYIEKKMKSAFGLEYQQKIENGWT